MSAHIRAHLLLLVLTVALCCVVYPLALWAVGQSAFRDHANGSLIYDDDGKPIAARLIAHEVKGPQYFQPRPSATGGGPYNAAASGASNYGASNPALRDRVARSLAPLAKYGKGPRQGEPVAGDMVQWYRDEKQAGRAVPKVKDERDEDEVAAAAFDAWRAAHPDVALEDVPADLVMASGSGLDPHITLDGALYQLPRVADEWAKRTKSDPATVRRDVEAMLQGHAIRQAFSVPLINVVEINIALHRKFTK